MNDSKAQDSRKNFELAIHLAQLFHRISQFLPFHSSLYHYKVSISLESLNICLAYVPILFGIFQKKCLVGIFLLNDMKSYALNTLKIVENQFKRHKWSCKNGRMVISKGKLSGVFSLSRFVHSTRSSNPSLDFRFCHRSVCSVSNLLSTNCAAGNCGENRPVKWTNRQSASGNSRCANRTN